MYRQICKQTCKLCIRCLGVQLLKNKWLPSVKNCILFARELTDGDVYTVWNAKLDVSKLVRWLRTFTRLLLTWRKRVTA